MEDASLPHLDFNNSYYPCAGTVEEVLPRRSELPDPRVANVDQVCTLQKLRLPADCSASFPRDALSASWSLCKSAFGAPLTPRAPGKRACWLTRLQRSRASG